MTDWDNCPGVWRDPGRLGGTLCFRDTRVPVATLFHYLGAGDTIEEVFDNFPSVTREHVAAVFDHVLRDIEAAAAHTADREPSP